MARWMMRHVVWDTSGAAGRSFRGALWASRKLLAAVAGSALLTWWEWIGHHPPAIAVVALIHLVFVLAAIVLAVYIRQRLRHRGRE